jgi:hypothetical protein
MGAGIAIAISHLPKPKQTSPCNPKLLVDERQQITGCVCSRPLPTVSTNFWPVSSGRGGIPDRGVTLPLWTRFSLLSEEIRSGTLFGSKVDFAYVELTPPIGNNCFGWVRIAGTSLTMICIYNDQDLTPSFLTKKDLQERNSLRSEIPNYSFSFRRPEDWGSIVYRAERQLQNNIVTSYGQKGLIKRDVSENLYQRAQRYMSNAGPEFELLSSRVYQDNILVRDTATGTEGFISVVQTNAFPYFDQSTQKINPFPRTSASPPSLGGLFEPPVPERKGWIAGGTSFA